MQEAAEVVAKLRGIRAWEIEHLPVRDSVVRHDILLALLESQLSGSGPLGFKAVCLAIRRSQRTTRLNLRRLQDLGWVICRTENSDGRRKNFVVAPVRMATLDMYLNMYLKKFGC